MTDLRAYLTPAQDADRRADRDVFIKAPTEACQASGCGDGYHEPIGCPTCDGGGRVPISDTVPCPECEGDGLMEVRERWGPFRGTEGIVADCDACDGSGRVPRTVEVVRPEMVDGATVINHRPRIPRAVVALAQVEAVPVVREFEFTHDRQVGHDPVLIVTDEYEWESRIPRLARPRTVHWHDPGRHPEGTNTDFSFPDGPPEPGTVLWRLHDWEDIEEQTTVLGDPCTGKGNRPDGTCGTRPGEFCQGVGNITCVGFPSADGVARRVPLPDLPPGIHTTGEQ